MFAFWFWVDWVRKQQKYLLLIVAAISVGSGLRFTVALINCVLNADLGIIWSKPNNHKLENVFSLLDLFLFKMKIKDYNQSWCSI